MKVYFIRKVYWWEASTAHISEVIGRCYIWSLQTNDNDVDNVAYGKNFRYFNCALTEIWILEKLDGLYLLSYKVTHKINLSPFFTDMFKWAQLLNLEVSRYGLSSETLKSNIWK